MNPVCFGATHAHVCIPHSTDAARFAVSTWTTAGKPITSFVGSRRNAPGLMRCSPFAPIAMHRKPRRNRSTCPSFLDSEATRRISISGSRTTLKSKLLTDKVCLDVTPGVGKSTLWNRRHQALIRVVPKGAEGGLDHRSTSPQVCLSWLEETQPLHEQSSNLVLIHHVIA